MSEWTNINDNLPKKIVGDKGYRGYLIITDYGQYAIADFTTGMFCSDLHFYVDGEFADVLYWMELPIPPHIND